ncbi:MAG: hypothetical protein E7515_03145 [Ruminococcaceae bacterium]|nr:hypothetical protein [Oscillospiraceae bacterium]
MEIKSLMKCKQRDLENKLNVPLDHPTTKGDHREAAWIDFFRSFLPSKYAIDKGFVFDAKGGISEQIDIIIYDALYTPLIYTTDAGEKYITAESVYAVFDSKPKIDKSTLEYTNKKIESVTNLYRSNRGVVVAGRENPPRELTPIYGGILALDSVTPETIIEHVKNYSSIDFGCSIHDFTFHVRRDDNRHYLSMITSAKDETILAFYYLILEMLYKIGTVAGLDIRDYADTTLTQFKIERGD